MGGVDHQLVWSATLGRQCGEDPVEHPKPAPGNEAVVDRLVRAIVLRGVTPAQASADHEYDPAHHLAIVDLAILRDNGKYGVVRRIGASISQIKSLLATPPRANSESIQRRPRKQFNRS